MASPHELLADHLDTKRDTNCSGNNKGRNENKVLWHD